MPRLAVKQKNWLLSAHVAFAALWTGTVLSMCLLALRNQLKIDVNFINHLYLKYERRMN